MATTATTYEELLKENEELKAQIQTTQQNQTQYQTQGNPTTPTKYVSPYAQEIESLAGELKNSAFEYRKQEDPNWQAMRKEYLLAADRTADDVLAKASVNTGGRASSYAVMAASQAANDVRASLSQAELDLYDQAYNRYYQEYSKKLQDLQNLRQQDADNYDRWLTEETLAQEQKDKAYDDLVTLIATTGHTPSQAQLEAAGMTAEEAASWKNYYQTQMELARSSGGGSGGGGGGSSGTGAGSGGTDEATTGAGSSSLLDRIDDAYASGGYEAALREVDDAYKSGEIVGVGGIDTSTGSAGKSAYNSYVNMLETGVDTSGWRDFVRNTYNNMVRARKNGDSDVQILNYLKKHIDAGNMTSDEVKQITRALGIG